MSQQQLGSSCVFQHGVEVLHGNGLSGKALSLACDSCNVQELEPEIPAAGTCATSSSSTEDHHVDLFQYVQALLEEGLFEKALSLSCECYRDPELGKDTVFLETALILFTNMEKLDMMWTEVKNLDSMQQLYPVAKTLSQYYLSAALLTAEMLLCKEWCEKTVSLSDLRKVTTLWVSLLRAQCGRNNEAFQTKVLQVGKLIVHEPTFILNLVKSIHAEVGRQSLVICLNLCLMALQEPLKDPQSNLVSASRIDTNNAALCRFLSEVLTEDTSLRRLCLLTAFTITPTKELLAEVDRVYKSVAVQIPDVPIMPSCLNCVLVHGMYSLLPDAICPLVDWRELRGKCLKYLRDSSVLNVQVKLPNREMALKVYVKKISPNVNEEEGERMEPMKSATKTKAKEGSSEEQDQDLPRLRTESEQRWLSAMMSLDMSWQPHWLTTSDAGNQQAEPDLKESQTQSQKSPELGIASDVPPPDQEEVHPCAVVLCNFKDTLLGHFHLLEDKANNNQSHQSTQEESPGALLTALQEDHAYSLPPSNQHKQTPNEELCVSQEMSTTEEQKKTLNVVEEWNDKDQYQHNMVTQGLNGIQLTTGTPVEEGSENSDRSRHEAVLHGNNQEHIDPTIERCLDSLDTELSYLEEQNNLEKSPEREDRLTDEGSNLEVHQNFLADLKDDMIDPELPVLNPAINGSISTEEEPPSDLAEDINRWFQNIKQPSEASSIVGSDVTPDPVTEEGMQWSAIEAISGDGNQTLYESGWNELSLWFSEDEDVKKPAAPKLAVSSSITGASLPTFRDPDSLEIRNPEADSGRGICSLESTINRLRANLCVVDSGPCQDEWEDSPEVTSSSPPTSSLQTPRGKSSKQQHTQLNVFSQQSYHQQLIDGQSPKVDQTQTSEQSTERPVFNQQSFVGAVTTLRPSTDSPKSTDPQPIDNATLNQLSFNRQIAADCLPVGNSTNQQDSNQPSDNPLPVMKHAIGQGSSNKPPAGKQEHKAKVGTTETSSHFVNIRHNDLICGTETLMLDTTSSDSLQHPRSNTEAVLHPHHSRNDKETNSSPQKFDASEQHNEVQQDLFTNESPSRSSIMTISPDIKTEKRVDLTCEEKPALESENATDFNPQYDVATSMSAAESDSMNSSLVHKTTRTESDFKETPFQNESRTRLLDSLLSFAVQEYRQITGSSADRETARNTDTVESTSERSLAKEDHKLPLQLSSQTSRDGDAASVSENPDVTTQVIHSTILHAPADLLSGVELSPEHKPDGLITFQNGQLAISNTERYATEAAGWRNAGHYGIPDSSNDVKLLAQRKLDNSNHQLLESESYFSNDRIKEFQSDSDCSDFEVVQDVSSRWSVSGKRKTSEPYSWPHKKVSGQHQEVRKCKERSETQIDESREIRETQIDESREMRETPNTQMSENKSDPAKRKATVSCSTSPLKEDKQNLQEAGRSSVTDETQAPKLAAKVKRKDSTTSAKNKSDSTGKVKETTSPPSHGYNLRDTDRPLNYFVAGSSSETSGEERGTKMGYSLRSAAAHSSNAKSSTSRTPKKPPRAFKSVQTRPRSQPHSNRSCRSAPGKKAGSLAKPGSKRRSLNPCGKCIADLNNNCSSGSTGTVISHHTNSSTPASKKSPSAIHPKVASPKQTPGVRGRYTAIKNPQLPWEAKPPIRTYSSKRKRSSTL
ncbi:uncharacterized protein LOC119737796 [Patiria miniata]|uniref:Zinc finger protein Rlf/292/654 TPR repeats domain-containing protein n=1 Tax=Patiria miniata TaxID=46514 RepID=A0A914AXB6_PATMI|nr:uncharacterized protein LOC119737796 [Patiria miniata]